MLTKKGTEQNLSSYSIVSAIALFLVLAAAAFFLFRAYDIYKFSPAVRLSQAISRDLQNLNNKGALPKGFDSLKGFEVSTEGSTFKPWTDELKIHFPTDSNGKFILQTFIFFYINGKHYGANVQYDLIEAKTENTVWELNRSYELGWIL